MEQTDSCKRRREGGGLVEGISQGTYSHDPWAWTMNSVELTMGRGGGKLVEGSKKENIGMIVIA